MPEQNRAAILWNSQDTWCIYICKKAQLLPRILCSDCTIDLDVLSGRPQVTLFNLFISLGSSIIKSSSIFLLMNRQAPRLVLRLVLSYVNDDSLTLPFSSHFAISLIPPLHSHLPDETLWYQVGQGASSPEMAAVTRTTQIKNLIIQWNLQHSRIKHTMQ